jgi:DNA-binding CsgD family transcriptional regulator
MAWALTMYAEGKSQGEIAAFFRRKEGTIAARLREARRRLGVATLDEAVVEARRRGLIEASE